MADYIKCKLIGGRSTRHLDTFSNFFLMLQNSTHIFHYKIIRTYQNFLLSIVDCIYVRSATESFEDIIINYSGNHDNRYFVRSSVIASFGHGNS